MLDEDFLNEINAHTSKPITAEDLDQKINDINSGNPDLDVIEVVEP